MFDPGPDCRKSLPGRIKVPTRTLPEHDSKMNDLPAARYGCSREWTTLFGGEFQNSSGLAFGGVHSRAEIGGNKSGDERKMDLVRKASKALRVRPMVKVS